MRLVFNTSIFASCPQWTVCFSNCVHTLKYMSRNNCSPLTASKKTFLKKSAWQVAHIDLVIRGPKSSGLNAPDSPSAAVSPVQKTPPCSVTVRYS